MSISYWAIVMIAEETQRKRPAGYVVVSACIWRYCREGERSTHKCEKSKDEPTRSLLERRNSNEKCDCSVDKSDNIADESDVDSPIVGTFEVGLDVFWEICIWHFLSGVLWVLDKISILQRE